MTVKSPFAMYKAIAIELLGPKTTLPRTSKDICSLLRNNLTTTGKAYLTVFIITASAEL